MGRGDDGGIKGAVYGDKNDAGNKEDKTNNFWFAHPVYFMKHLDDAGLLSRNAEILRQVQDRVVEIACLKKGGGGYYHNPSTTDTYCNQATFLTIQAVDGNFRQFIAHGKFYNRDDPPSELKRLLGHFKEKYSGGYGHKSSNLWYEILEEQAAHSGETGICKIEAEEAQAKANLGYVVVAAWKNFKGVNEANNQPHYATVRPGCEYDSKVGPTFANVGKENNADATAKQAFGETIWKEVMYYYNRNQVFINPADDKNIKLLEDGGHL